MREKTEWGRVDAEGTIKIIPQPSPAQLLANPDSYISRKVHVHDWLVPAVLRSNPTERRCVHRVASTRSCPLCRHNKGAASPAPLTR